MTATPLEAPGTAWREAGVLALLYGVLAAVSIALLRQPGSVANIWYANAVAMAFLVTSPMQRWPGLLVGAMVGNGAANLLFGFAPGVALALAPANAIETVLAALLLRRAGLAQQDLRTPRAMLKLIAFGAFAPQVVGATLAALAMQQLGLGSFGLLWQRWYEGSAIGSISLLALAIGLRRGTAEASLRELLDWRVGVFGLVAAGIALLSLAHVPFPFVYVSLPLLVAAMVLELNATLALVMLSSLVVAFALGTGVLVPPPFTAAWQQVFVYTAYAAALLPAQLLASAVAAMRDSHERLAAAKLELQRANEGLEQFVRIASHDLREPLNTIVQFTGLIEQDHGAQLPGAAREWLGLVGRAGARMRSLLDDVLDYVRVQRSADDPGTAVALDTVMEEVLQALAGRIRETGAGVSIEPLPVVRGHPSLLALVFQNLLSNALKFVPPGRTPQVAVRGWRDAGFAVVEVGDNGIGVAEQDLPKLFQPFKRLHLRKHYDGTGLGLALVRQVVQAHGGSVTMASEPGQGTRLTVRLPLEAPD